MAARNQGGQRWTAAIAMCAVLAMALAGPAACGGGGDGESSAGQTLFEGDAAALIPHQTGSTASFQVTARQGAQADVSGFTTTVTNNAPDGAFRTRYVSDTGAVAERIARDLGDEIRVEQFIDDPGSPGEVVTTPEPPTVVVRAPVVAGEAIETSFVRTLTLSLRVGSTTEQRSIAFVGSARRVPRERGSVRVADGTYPDAIRYQVEASGEATLPVLGEGIPLRVEVTGDEWFAIGVGGVREELEVEVQAGDERDQISFTTEREGPPPGA